MEQIPSTSSARVVGVWYAPADKGTADEIIQLLTARNFHPQPYSQDDSHSHIVCILSPAAIAHGVDEVAEASRGCRLVVVCTAPLDGAEVPSELAEPHWLLWRDFSPAERAGLLTTALTSTIDDRRAERTLTSDARIWSTSGRQPDHLADPKTVTSMMAELKRRSDAGNPYLPEVVEFVTASSHKARALRRRSTMRWGVRLLAVGAIAILVTTGLYSLDERRRVNSLVASTLLTPTDMDRPHYSAARLIGALNELRDYRGPRYPLLETAATNAVTQRWPVLSLAHMWDDSAAVALDRHSGQGLIIAGEGRGNIVGFDSSTGSVQWRITVSDARITALASTPDGRRVVALDDDQILNVVDVNGTGPVRTVPVGPAREVSVSDDGRRALVVGSVLTEVDLDSMVPAPIEVSGAVLAAARSSSPDRLWSVLARRGEVVDLMDPMSGRIFSSSPLPASEFEIAALSADGRSAAFATSGLLVEFTDTGEASVVQSVPDVVADLAVAISGDIAVSSRAAGNQVVLADGRITDRFCTQTSGGTETIAWTADGALSCLHGMGILVDRPDRPALPPPPDQTLHTVLDVPTPDTVALPSPATVSAASPRTGDAALGTARGIVVLLGTDFEGNQVETARWTIPSHQPVTGLSWSDTGDALLARTSDDRWWSVRVCADCAADLDALTQHARTRFSACFDPAMERLFAARTVDKLGIRTCESGPIPERRPR